MYTCGCSRSRPGYGCHEGSPGAPSLGCSALFSATPSDAVTKSHCAPEPSKNEGFGVGASWGVRLLAMLVALCVPGSRCDMGSVPRSASLWSAPNGRHTPENLADARFTGGIGAPGGLTLT